MLNPRFVAQMQWELRELAQAFKTKRFYAALLATLLGSLAGSIAINGVLIPRSLFSPGTSGISLLVYYLAGWPSVGVVYLLLNIPIFIIGWREYALKYVFISAVGVLIYTGALIATEDVVIPAPDPLMASILGGLLMGVGSGFYLRLGGSAGGLDILATYVRKKLGVPISGTLNAVNIVNLVGALLLFDLSTAFYSAVFMGVNSWMLERTQTGFSQHRAVFIITRAHQQVAWEIRERLNRGVTFFSAQGGHSGRPMQVVYAVINMYELGRLKDIMFRLDPDAYVMVSNTTEVIGRRFHSWEDQGYRRPFDWPPDPKPGAAAPVAD